MRIVKQDGSLHFTGTLNRDTLMQYSPFTLLNDASGTLRFDLSGLSAIDTAGLAWVIKQLAVAQQKGVTVKLCNVPQQLLSLADVSAVRPLLPVMDEG
nr:STAS domain-containing protein [Rheinheimera maricola]